MIKSSSMPVSLGTLIVYYSKCNLKNFYCFYLYSFDEKLERYNAYAYGPGPCVGNKETLNANFVRICLLNEKVYLPKEDLK